MAIFAPPQVTSTDVASLARLYGLSDVHEIERLGGTPNVTFRVKERDISLAIRICNDRYTSKEHLQCEVDLLEHLPRVGFPRGPILVRGSDGQSIQRWQGHRLIATQFINGSGLDKLLPDLALSTATGVLVGELSKALDSFRPTLSVNETYWARSARLIDLLPRAARDLAWPIDVPLIRHMWERVASELACTPETQRVVHTDVWPPNLLLSTDGLRIIDFDDLALALPLLDLASAIAEFCMNDSGHLKGDHTLALLTGFQSSGTALLASDSISLAAGIVGSNISWLACNAAHSSTFAESAVYSKRIEYLSRRGQYDVLVQQLARSIQNTRP